MYPSLKKDLQEIVEALKENENADWFENDPADEFEALAQMLESAINKDRKRDKAEDNLSHYTSGADSEGEYRTESELLDLLLAQAEEDGSVYADEVVTMWEPLESRYTVNDLLEMIGAI
jgi:endonuclease III